MAHYMDPGMFEYLDESAVDGQSGLWANGWTPVNVQSVARTMFFQVVYHSTLEIFDGSVTKGCFIWFTHKCIVKLGNRYGFI